MAPTTETDPLVMYIVIRSDATVPFVELAQHVVTATMRCVGDHAASRQWAKAFVEWEAGIYHAYPVGWYASIALPWQLPRHADGSVSVTPRGVTADYAGACATDSYSRERPRSSPRRAPFGSVRASWGLNHCPTGSNTRRRKRRSVASRTRGVANIGSFTSCRGPFNSGMAMS